MKHISNDVLETLKDKLQEERKKLIGELEPIAQQDPDNPANWNPIGDDAGSQTSADPNKRADNMEEYESNTAIVNDLEVRLLQVNTALKNIESESYGVCTECGEGIPEDRLLANPAATTCVNHG